MMEFEAAGSLVVPFRWGYRESGINSAKIENKFNRPLNKNINTCREFPAYTNEEANESHWLFSHLHAILS